MKRPNSFQVIFSILNVTFREIIRDKVLYNVLICAFLLFGVALFASKLTSVSPDRVVLDFGLSAVVLSSVLLTLFIGSSIIPKEIENRTIHLSFSRPIRVQDFILGKFLGLLLVILVNSTLLSLAFLGFLYLVSPEETRISTTLGYGLVLVYFQCFLLGSISIALSIFTTTSLAVSLSIGLFFIGQNISHLELLAARLENPFLRIPVQFISQVFPNFEYFSLGTKVTYGLPVSFEFVLYSIFYAFILVTILLFIASLLMKNREI